jgi:hypothetical protein
MRAALIALSIAVAAGCAPGSHQGGRPDGDAGSGYQYDTGTASETAADAPGDGGEASEPALNGVCTSAQRLDSTSSVVYGKLADARDGYPSCGGGSGDGLVIRSLFYSIDVPGGHRLLVQASATPGTRAWTPRLAASEACDGAICLAQGTAAVGSQQRLSWINNGGTTRTIILAVASDDNIAKAEFSLRVGVTNLLSTCAKPTPIAGGMVVNQTLATVPPAKTCAKVVQPTLYYSVTLLPQQELKVSSISGESMTAVNVALRSACDDVCANAGATASRVNVSSEPETVVIEVTPASMQASPLFDLQITLPPPLAAVIVTPTTPLVTTEGGGQATFRVSLLSEPTAAVAIALSSDRPGEGTPSPSSLVFEPGDWSQPRTVTVTGVDDAVGDGAQRYTIATAPAVSMDTRYSGFDPDDIRLTNLDDDPSLVVEGADDLVTSEEGASATFTVRLTVAPTAAVTVPLASRAPAEGAVSPASLTFTTQDWSTPQTVTVTGADDDAADGTRDYSLSLGPPASSDPRYASLTQTLLTAHNRDDDFEGTSSMLAAGVGCGVPLTPNQFPMAVDSAGGIHLVLQCSGNLFLYNSSGGGKTFGQRIPVHSSDTDTPLSTACAVAAGRGGTVYVVYGLVGRGLQLSSTLDAGKTWTRRTLLPYALDQVRIAAARDTVVIAGGNAFNTSVPNASLLWSQDGGQSFASQVLQSPHVKALSVQPDGRSVWLIDEAASLLASRDGGVTFQPVGTIADEELFLFGPKNAYSIGPAGVQAVSLADPSHTEMLLGPSADSFAAAVDDAGVLTLIRSSGTANLYAQRVGASGPTQNYTIFSSSPAGAVALSRRAVAVAGSDPSGVKVTVVTWP